MMMTTLFASEGEQWTAEHYGSALEEAFVQEMGEEIGIREYRQIQAAFSSHWLSKWTDILVEVDEATFEQQGHTTATHDRDYDRTNGQSHGLRLHHQLRYELASIQWQKLVFPVSVEQTRRSTSSTDQIPAVESIKRLEMPKPTLKECKVPDASNAVESVSTTLSALNALRTLLKSETATFRSTEQARATALLLLQGGEGSAYHRRDVLVILPTGMGKTLTWLVASELEAQDRLTIVVVPLNALILDLDMRLGRYGKQVHRPKPGLPLRLEGMKGCLLLSADRIVHDDVLREIHAWEHRIVSILLS